MQIYFILNINIKLVFIDSRITMKKQYRKLGNFLGNYSIAAGIISLSIVSNNANADIKFYAGMGLDYNNYGLTNIGKDFSDISRKLNGIGVLAPTVGLRFNKYFGVETGYNFNKKIKMSGIESQTEIVSAFVGNAQNQFQLQNNPITTTYRTTYVAKVQNAYFDLMGFMPVINQFELTGGIGIGRLIVKGNTIDLIQTTAAGVATSSTNSVKIKNKTSYRVKLGVQCNVTNNFWTRLLATYQNTGTKIGDDKIIKNTKTIGLAAIYMF